MCEYEVQYHQRLEQERAQWNQYRESLERELGELRRRLTEGQEEENLENEMKKVDVINSMSKCAVCKVLTVLAIVRLTTSQMYLNVLLEFAATQHVLQLTYVQVSNEGVWGKNLLKAQEDAEKLRSVVMPMEHEIAALKAKLTSAEDRVKELEASKVSWC